MKRNWIAAVVLTGWCLLGRAGDELIIDIGVNDDLGTALGNAITTSNGRTGPVFVRFEAGTHRFETPPSGPTLTPPISGEIVFLPVSDGTDIVLTASSQATGRAFEITSSGQATLDGIDLSGFNGSADGGGIFNNGGTLNLSNSTISGNTSTGNGGGIFSSGGTMTFDDVTISGNNAQNGGGIFLGGSGGNDLVDVRGSTFSDNSALGDGGAIGIDITTTGGADTFTFDDVMIHDNHAGINGGGIDLSGNGPNDPIVFRNLRSENNTAGVFGEHLDVNVPGAGPSPVIIITDSILAGNAPGVVGIENPAGAIGLLGLIVETDAKDGLDSTDQIFVGNSIFGGIDDAAIPKRGTLVKTVCNTFGVGVIQSLGGNIASDGSCGLDDATDQQNANAMVIRDPSNGKFGLRPGSPVVDAAQSAIASLFPGDDSQLECGYKDVNGLGRPQDGNLDGVFECDSGFVEMQGGPDIGAAQSAAYFDTGRNGEGVFVELIGGGLAFVAFFTYQPDGSGAAWFVGIGNVVGNSVVVDNMLEVAGGVFGAGFDSGAIRRSTIGGLSLVFPNCAAGGQPGRMTFQSRRTSNYSNLFVEASRLSTIVECSGGSGSPQAGRSGSFFDTSRSGEGIFVQWLSNGSLVVIWYTFATQHNGNPLWIINDGGRTTVSGSTVTATMLYPTAFTSFGSGYDPSEVVLSDWGTVTLGYRAGCQGMDFGYSATAPGFGSGSFDYSRLTGLTGTTCDL